MRIAVLMKTATGVAIDAADTAWREARTLAGVMAPHDAHAVEAAVRLREQGAASEVVLVAIAGTQVLGALREGLASGADRAIILSDPALERADLLGRSKALSALLTHIGPDLSLYCPWSGDVDGSLLWSSAAARLGMPSLGQARSLELTDGEVRCVRQVEAGDLHMAASLPCIVEVTDGINKPRYPTMKGRQAARAKRVDTMNLAAIGLAAEDVAPATRVLSTGPAPARAVPRLIEDEAEAVGGIMAFLEEKRLLP